MRIRMIRHGEAAAGWGGGDADPGLSELGRAQALAARDALLALPNGERPTLVVSSPLRRCRETAQPFAEAIGAQLIVDPGVGEIPTPAALNAAERGPWLRRAFQGRWDEIEGDLDYDAWRRSVAAAALSRPGAAVFSHFVAINAVLSLALGKAAVAVARPDNGSIHVFEAGPDGRPILLEQGREAATQVL